jgi:hypothetical protein
MKPTRLVPAVATMFSAAALAAQAAQPDSYSGSYSTRFGHATKSDIAQGGTGLGEIGSSEFELRYTAGIRVSETYSYSVGLEYDRRDFSLPAALPAPTALHETALKLGNRWRFADHWILSLSVSPGLYSDFEDISGEDFNIPALLLVTYAPGKEWQFAFGLIVNPGSETPVLPAVGAVWRPDEQWTLSLLMPRPQVSYRVNDALTAFVYGELSSRAYRVAEDFGTKAGNPALNGERLTYREIKAGTGIRYAISRALEFTLEGGWLIDRRFIYADRDLQFNGDGAPFVQIGISGSY